MELTRGKGAGTIFAAAPGTGASVELKKGSHKAIPTAATPVRCAGVRLCPYAASVSRLRPAPTYSTVAERPAATLVRIPGDVGQ